MKTAGILTFAVGTLAAVSRRQEDLSAALTAIAGATTDLDTAIQGFSGDIESVDSATAAVLSAIQDATTLAEGLSEITFDQAVALTGPTGSINTAVDSAITNTIAKQSAFEEACAATDVYTSLMTQQEASAALSSAIVAKLPEALQGLGADASKPAAEALQKGLDAFEGAENAASCEAGGDDTSSAAPSSYAASTMAASTAASTMAASSASGKSCPPKSTSGSANVTSPAMPTSTDYAAPVPYTGAAVKTAAGIGAVVMAVVAALF